MKPRTKSVPLAACALFLATLMAGVLASCNTTQGFGEDLSSAGKGISHSAEKNK
jgi:predicted small secreted protein